MLCSNIVNLRNSVVIIIPLPFSSASYDLMKFIKTLDFKCTYLLVCLSGEKGDLCYFESANLYMYILGTFK